MSCSRGMHLRHVAEHDGTSIVPNSAATAERTHMAADRAEMSPRALGGGRRAGRRRAGHALGIRWRRASRRAIHAPIGAAIQHA